MKSNILLLSCKEWRAIAVLAAAVVYAATAVAEQFTWTGGANDGCFTNHLNYADTENLPGDGDTLVVPADTTIYITNAAQVEYVSRLTRIHPSAPSSRIVVDVPSGGDWHLRCGVSSVKLNGAGNKDFVNGELVKRGEGTLTLGEGGKLPASNSAATIYDAWTGLTVEGGTLALPQSVSNNWNFYCGYVTVSNGATFHLAERAAGYDKGSATYLRGLFGDGTVCCNQVLTFTLMGESNQRVSDFNGKITGCPSFSVYNGGTVNLWGTNSDFDVTALTISSGTLGVKFFGSSSDTASSIGSDRIGVNINNSQKVVSRVRYLGTGENTDQNFTISQGAPTGQPVGNPACIDGDEHGGLVLNASSKLYVGSSATNAAGVKLGRQFILSGSHTNDCVIAGAVKGNYYSNPWYYDNLYFIKEGSGTWRFADHDDRIFASGFAVREGTLKFDSLQEKGRLCSLGLATNLTDGTGYAYTPQVDYAFALGPTNGMTVAAPAALEYSGTNGFVCTDRPIALVGDGVLRNNTDRRIRFAGVSSLAPGQAIKTFTLDGTGTNFNEVADISDGAGKTGVEKTGDGVWVLSGDQTFSGPLSVKKGTLVVRPTLPGQYTWFRWTIKSSGGDTQFSISNLGLFATNGTCQTRIMLPVSSAAELQPGQVAVDAIYPYVDEARSETCLNTLDYLFNMQQDYGWQPKFKKVPPTTGSIYVKADQPHTWIPVVFRQPSTAKPIATFDFMNTWGSSNKKYGVSAYSLEGSVDGLHWNTLTNDMDVPFFSASFTWIGSQTILVYGERAGNYVHTSGMPIEVATSQTYSMLENVESVSVAPGAKLLADGDVTLSSISLAATGGGTIEGFSFADEGVLDVTGWEGSMEEIPLSFVNSETFAKVGDWTLVLDGLPTKRRGFTVSSTGITLKPVGTAVIIR